MQTICSELIIKIERCVSMCLTSEYKMPHYIQKAIQKNIKKPKKMCTFVIVLRVKQ